MNFEAYKRWRDAMVRERNPTRLDCMNPVVALRFLRPPDLSPIEVPLNDLATNWPERLGFDQEAMVRKWSELSGFDLGERFVISRGIRTLLRTIFALFGRDWKQIWLPQDVYPVYWELAKPWPCAGFRTWPQLDLSAVLASDTADCLLLPSPLTPVGRYLTSVESETLLDWLEQQETRRLLLDTVYQFSGGIPPATATLMAHPQCTVLHSVSKSWISRQVLGVMNWPRDDHGMVTRMAECPHWPELAELNQLMNRRPDLTATMSADFSAEWKRLTPRLREVDPEWLPPATGYFSLLRGNTETLLEHHNLMTVPGSVFGSDESQWSVICCLHDLHRHTGGSS